MKTDGQNLYTYSEESHEIRIVRASDLTLQNTIKFPEGFSSLQLYIVDGKLVVVGQKYSQLGNMYTARWYAPEMKSFIAIYRINDPKIPILERYSQIDGSYRDSRVVNNTVYLISTSDFRIPPVYLTRYSSQKEAMAKTIGDIEKNFNIKTFAPEIRESNLGIKGKYIQNIRSSAANCKDVTFVLPDANTLKNIEFNPTLISLSSLDLSNATAKMKSELLFGDVSQIHMSQSSLYITSTISQSSPSTCPPNAKCFAPSYMSASSTLVHRYALKNG